ncbi:uncharacterized protein METZ01_LOCUS454288, partial [marine metagenome]
MIQNGGRISQIQAPSEILAYPLYFTPPRYAACPSKRTPRWSQRYTQIEPELISEITTDPGVHPTLSVEKPLRISNWKDPLVPNIGVDIETTVAVTPQRNHPGRIKVVPRLGHGKHERCLFQRIKQ